jgi:hypothetical protein
VCSTFWICWFSVMLKGAVQDGLPVPVLLLATFQGYSPGRRDLMSVFDTHSSPVPLPGSEASGNNSKLLPSYRCPVSHRWINPP